jgi:peptide/nickel transport system ATP-binding protein
VPERAVAEAAAPLLSVRNLRVEFPTRRGRLVAVHDVSFDIAAGEVLGVVGESGAGKSLTGAAIIGLIDPPGRIAGGEVHLDGRRIDRLPYDAMRRVRGREIGAIFQDPLTSLNPLYTIGRQLVETIRTHLDMNEAQARARAVALLEEVGIPAAARRVDQYPHQFSGGMRQRVVIALALAARPKLIIADEPTTALDVSIQAQIIQLLKRLCRDHGTSVMLVTHDMGVIAETAHRVAVMYAGRIVEIGPVADVIHRAQHPYSIGLMGSIPSIAQDRERLAQIDGTMPRLTAVPPGCPFHPRCPRAFVRCTRDRPELMPASTSLAACWLHDPVARLEAHQRIAPASASAEPTATMELAAAEVQAADTDHAGARGRDPFVPPDDVAGTGEAIDAPRGDTR